VQASRKLQSQSLQRHLRVELLLYINKSYFQYKDYFDDAMEYFTNEYDNVVFVYVSDDMEWGRKKLGKAKNIFFVGCGDGDEMVAVFLD